ncbi:MAG TPA: RNHCP domain-containing protein [Chloroflexota bacterium]|nr:RNHCP domain-containing protein [Chloroflexota bacterium]
MSRTYRYDSPRRWPTEDQGFRCRKCRMFVVPPPSGGKHRNHCPFCLHSRHVDGDHPGDRAGHCGGLMAPIGAFSRPKGEQVLVHRCLACGFERHNRIAADDDFDLVLVLPALPPRGKQPAYRRPGEAEETA